MAAIGGCKTDGNFGNVSSGVLFSKVVYQQKRYDIQVVFQSFLSIAVLNLGQCHLS